MTNEEHPFAYAQRRLRLSDTEKALGRDRLLADMRLANQKAAVPSPYAHLFRYGLRYALAAVLIVAATGSGVAFAAEGSLPGEPLYAVKVGVTEPIRVALTTDPKQKADLEVGLVDEHLQDISEAALKGTLDQDAADAAVDSLNRHIDAAQAAIKQLHAANATGAALDSAATLSATLDAHADILDRVATANPGSAAALDQAVATVDESLVETDGIIATTSASIEGASSTALTGIVDGQQARAADSLESLRADVTAGLETLDADARAAVTGDLAAIQETVALAEAKDAAGDEQAALSLYLQASEQMTALGTKLDASQSLDLDLVSASDAR